MLYTDRACGPILSNVILVLRTNITLYYSGPAAQNNVLVPLIILGLRPNIMC